MLETLTKETWIKYLGETFDVDTGNAIDLNMILTHVSGFGTRPGAKREAFSLLFSGPVQPVLPQRIYRIVHADMGELEIFLVPIGPQADGMGYEAIFN